MFGVEIHWHVLLELEPAVVAREVHRQMQREHEE